MYLPYRAGVTNANALSLICQYMLHNTVDHVKGNCNNSYAEQPCASIVSRGSSPMG